jgi:hypothetical protein
LHISEKEAVMFGILKYALLAAGFLHLIPLLAGLCVPRVLHWDRDLSKLDPLSRQLIWVHGAFIVLTIVCFGALTLFAAESLLQGTILGVGVAGFMGLFWLFRLLIQLYYFDPHPWLTTSFRRVGYKTLTFLFGYFSVVYFLTAGFNLRLIWRS